MNVPNSETLDRTLPWLLFKLKDQIFAVNSRNIATIFQMDDPVTPVPEFPEHARGILNLRGSITPVVDMRKFFHMQSCAEEYKEFSDMLEERKQDHIKWMDELERAIKMKEPFRLTTDPHRCAFGRWYDKFHTDNQTISFHMKKIEEPHRLLHAMGAKALACQQDCGNCHNSVCIKTSLNNARIEYMPRVLGLLEQAKDLFEHHFREMCVVLRSDNDDAHFGMIVDEVLAVEEVEVVGESADIGKMPHSNLIAGIVRGKNLKGEILALDTMKMLVTFGELNVRA